MSQQPIGPGGPSPGFVPLLVEAVIPEGDVAHDAKLVDSSLLVVLRGQERTKAEWERLLSKSGFSVIRIVSTASILAVIEVIPA